jgi:hypothetical protein
MDAEYRERNMPNAEVIFELQLTFLEQGYYLKAMECSQFNLVVFRGPDDIPTIIFLLALLTSKFAGCFVRCDWEAALDDGGTIFSQICGSDDEILRDSLDHILLRVSHSCLLISRM